MSAAKSPSQLAALREQNALQAELIKTLQASNAQLQASYDQIRQQLDWFNRQLFGEKSEKRLNVDPAVQPSLFEGLVTDTPAPMLPPKVIAEHTRKQKLRNGCVTDTGLRFDDSVPVIDIITKIPELTGPNAHEYEIIRYEDSCKLAQRPGAYTIVRTRRPVVKHKPTQTLKTAPAPDAILDRSIADVSFLAGLLIDKFRYHLPLYRQHQRLADSGITLARSTLTSLSSRAIKLLTPIAEAQFRHVLQSKVLAIDETPVKAGRKTKGKLNTGYFWPLYGDADEVSFRYCSSRSGKHLTQLLDGFSGTLLTDGYEAYERYANAKDDITHSQCWAHTRRYFEKAQAYEPARAAEALQIIGALYENERVIRDKALTGASKQAYRIEHSKPVVDTFWQWCDYELQNPELAPPLGKALQYALNRRGSLEIFLGEPDVAVDTNCNPPRF